MIIDRIQESLRQAQLDAWLFFDHHRRDPIAYKILGIPEHVQATRRWYYFVPSQGAPQKLVHRIETGALDSLPGDKRAYSSWTEQGKELEAMLAGGSRVAMQYSPNCQIPYVSLVDGGTIELVRSFGIQVVSSADLVQKFEARWSEQQLALHIEAGKLVDQVRRRAFERIGEELRSAPRVDEFEIQQFILQQFAELHMTTDHGPIVAVNGNASDPHYSPSQERRAQIRPGDVVLIDLWAKMDRANAVYYDVTWTGYCGEAIPDEVQNVFKVVRDARKRASEFVIGKIESGTEIAGYEVDDVARGVISERGFGKFFFHRTGHSIGTEVHGTGANMDNLESHDERRIIAGTCFSIEPGVYLPEFGIRSEVNVYAGEGHAMVTGEEQQNLIVI